MMKINAEQVKHVAKLAKLSLADEEISNFSEQLSSIIDYVENGFAKAEQWLIRKAVRRITICGSWQVQRSPAFAN